MENIFSCLSAGSRQGGAGNMAHDPVCTQGSSLHKKTQDESRASGCYFRKHICPSQRFWHRRNGHVHA